MSNESLPVSISLRAILWILVLAGPANGLEMHSASFTSTGGATNAGSVAQTSTAPSPAFSSAAGSVGQGGSVGLAGSASSLRTTRVGFWPIVQQDLASLDLDFDGIQSFFDPDDDNDGLDDTVETDTGEFTSPLDTGSDPLNPDSDGDGVADGTEVGVGRDPNVADSGLPVPALSEFGLWFAIFALTLAGVRTLLAQKESQP